MTAIARRIFHLRRAVSDRWALLVLLGLWPLMALGRLSAPALLSGHLLPLAVLTMFGLTVLLVVLRELMPAITVSHASPPASAATQRTAVWAELELGLCFVTAVYVLIAATGGLQSFAYPLVYALVSFLMVVHRARVVAFAWLAATVGLEILVGWPSLVTVGWAPIAYHLTFIAFFAAGNLLVLSSLVRRLRHGHDVQVASALDKMQQEARDFRLIAAQLPLQSRARSRDAEEVRMAVAAVETIHEQLFHNVDLLRASLSLNTCVLLWCEEDARDARGMPRLSVKEVSTVSEAVGQNPVLEGPGLLTSVLAAPKPLRLKALGGRRVPPYYDGPPHPAAVTDLCVVPLLDGPNLRGLLCADRTGDRPFTGEEEATLTKAATHMLRVVEQERVFSAVERGKYEQEQFYRASELLGEALTLSDVFGKTFASARLIAHYDLAVLTLADASGDRHEVAAVDVGQGADGAPDADWEVVAKSLQGRALCGDRSLVGMAVKNRHFMPASGGLVDGSTVVFDHETRLGRAQSLLVLPLVRGDQVLGALTLVSSRARQYVPQTREMLRVISRQVAVSVDNARMYQAMEERATTDGLTGLTNHRAFQERMAQLHDLCERTQGHYSVILTDIDRFKSINDTYGHPVGDVVLKRVAAILSGRSRRVDIVARYGGEEFVLVLPDTDGEGAAIIANKLREEIEQQVMTSEHGSFKVTISMGVAEFPADGALRHALIEKSDQALYYCKEHGRNRVARWSQI